MKKYMMAIGSVIIFSSGANYAMTSVQLGDFYEKGIEETFFKYSRDKDSFYFFLGETMTSAMVNWCNKAASDIKSFVDSHSKNLVGIKDSLLNNTAIEFERLNIETINTIKVSKIVTAADKLMREALIQQYNIFEKKKKLKPQCSNLIAKLQKERFSIAEKKQAQDLLLRVLNILQNLIVVAQGSIKHAIDHT